MATRLRSPVTWSRGAGAAGPFRLSAGVARALGTSRQVAERAVLGPLNIARRCARVIAALKAAGDDEVLVQFIQPIDLAIHAAEPAAIAEIDRTAAAVPSRERAQAFLDRIYVDIARHPDRPRAGRRAADPADADGWMMVAAIPEDGVMESGAGGD
jgi:hypothetical protein